MTTLSGGHATVAAIRALRSGEIEVRSLQEIYELGDTPGVGD